MPVFRKGIDNTKLLNKFKPTKLLEKFEEEEEELE